MEFPERNPSRAIIAAIVLLLAGAGVWWLLGRGDAATAPPAAAPVPVVVTRAEIQDVPEFVRGVGTVQSLHSVILRPQVDGILDEVLFEEGQLVQAGDLLARIDDRTIRAELDQARAARARNQALLDSAIQDLERYRSLLNDKTVARQVVDQQAAEVSQLQAALAADDAAIAAADVQLSFTRITSPVSGRAGLRRVDPGNLVRSSDEDGIVSIAQIDPIAVIFTLPQDLLPRVRALLNGDTGNVVTAYDRAGGTRLAQGRLLLVDNEINTATGTVRLKAEFANPEGALWPGQFVTAELQIGLYREALVVDAAAVQRGLDYAFVYRVSGNKAEPVPVKLAFENDSVAVIASGLARGDVIVRDGQSRLKPGDAVRILDADCREPPC